MKDVRYPTDAEGADLFAKAMKRKMARKAKQGYKGWQNAVSARDLAHQLADELTCDAPDPVDIGNFAMMLYCHGREGKRALREVSKTMCEAFGV